MTSLSQHLKRPGSVIVQVEPCARTILRRTRRILKPITLSTTRVNPLEKGFCHSFLASKGKENIQLEFPTGIKKRFLPKVD